MPRALADCPRCHGSGIEPGATFHFDRLHRVIARPCRFCHGTTEHSRARPYLPHRPCRSCGVIFAPPLASRGDDLLACPPCRARAGRDGYCRRCGTELQPSRGGRPRRYCPACDPNWRTRTLGGGGPSSPGQRRPLPTTKEGTTDAAQGIARTLREGRGALEGRDRLARPRPKDGAPAEEGRDDWRSVVRAGGRLGGVRIA